MASISRDSDGGARIQFVGADGVRRAIRLGKVTDRDAERVKEKIEQLNAATRAGIDPPGKLTEWLTQVGDDLHAKLVKAGLAEPRATAYPTLGEFLDQYRADRGDVAASTRSSHGVIGKRLVAFFGADRRMHDVSPGDADRFADWMRGERGYAPATASKTIKGARQLFRRAVRLRLVGENPFEGVKAGGEQNRERSFFVNADATRRVLDACPDHEWRLLVGLVRYGGLRSPGETLTLTWPDVLWDRGRFKTTSPKTRHQGKAERMVPIFPELRPLLEEAFEQAEPGTLHVIARYRGRGGNLGNQLRRIVRRAGLVPWTRLFQNLRASRETELAERFPLKVVTDWLGNSPNVALAHYLSTTEEHFRRAAESGAESGALAAQNPAQHGQAPTRTKSQESPEVLAAYDSMRDGASPCY